MVKYLIEMELTKKYYVKHGKKLLKYFLEIDDCEPSKQYTNELCSESFELPKSDD